MRLLDLYCGPGGAAKGYHDAGFTEIIGVDLEPQPHYPFTFIQADALTFPLDGFDVIHASPPCEDYSTANTWLRPGRIRKAHPRLIEPTRERLMRSGCIWVLENVRLAIDEMQYPVMLCGTAFGLRVQRHRLFDASVMLFSAGACAHRVGDISVRTHRREYLSVPSGPPIVDSRGNTTYRNATCPMAEAKKAMGIDWMNGQELGKAIPPAYTEWIGRQLMTVLRAQAA